jgi:hypothetical protein
MGEVETVLYERVKNWILGNYNIHKEEIATNRETCTFQPKLNAKEFFDWRVMSQKISEVFGLNSTVAIEVLLKFIEEEVANKS